MQVFELKNAICVHFCGKSNMSKIVCLGFKPGDTHKKKREVRLSSRSQRPSQCPSSESVTTEIHAAAMYA